MKRTFDKGEGEGSMHWMHIILFLIVLTFGRGCIELNLSFPDFWMVGPVNNGAFATIRKTVDNYG